MLLLATAIGASIAWLRRDVAYVAVLIWAFAGIAVKHSSNQFVWGASILAALVLAVLIALAWCRQR
jgi:ABC-type phosphate transport system permease subunit